MKILRSPEDLEAFILEESLPWGTEEKNPWVESELRNAIKPREYPCAVFIHWGEGASGMHLVKDIVYGSELVGTAFEMYLCATEHIFLRPNQLYMFKVADGCERCKKMAEISEKN